LTLDAISRLVDRFHTRAISGAEEEVEGAFLNFCQNALRICSRTLFEGAYEADIIECDPTGRLKLICASSAESHQWFPDMSITWGPDKKIVEPDAKSGVAAYCFYANVQLGWTGYAVAPNLPQRNIVFQRLGLAEDYPPHSVREVYKDPPTPGRAPYKTILCAPIMQGIDKTETWEDDAACVGVLSLTSKHPHAFDQAGGAWAMACAGLLGSMYGIRHSVRTRKAPQASPVPPLAEGKTMTSKFDDFDAIADELKGSRIYDLRPYDVVGDFVCFDPKLRQTLIRFVDDVRSELKTRTKPFPVLLCAEPGTGKTFFANQVAAEILRGGLIQINLSDVSTQTDLQGRLGRHYRAIYLADTPSIAFMDEVDTRVEGEHVYRYFLKPLSGDPCVKLDDGNAQRSLGGVLWFFAASSASDPTRFGADLDGIQKGRDFLRRFKENGRVLRLPGVSCPRERIVKFVALAHNGHVAEIEVTALLFVGLTSWRDAGEVKAAFRQAVAAKGGLTVLKLAHFVQCQGYEEFCGKFGERLQSLSDVTVFPKRTSR
tara:strand:+ start:459 stop:2087 length:1629 start_codon:yes stop_codon:yes gene_type:complete